MNPLLGKNGGLAGSITAVQCPDVQCSYVKFRAVYNNTGIVAIGHDLTVTLPSTAAATNGFDLSAGDDTGWIKCNNLKEFSYISTATTDDLVYITMP